VGERGHNSTWVTQSYRSSLGQPPGFVDVGDVGKQEIDPKNFGFLMDLGRANSGWIERLAIAIWWDS